jgi:ParB/RepB/Spo0J family partition protein
MSGKPSSASGVFGRVLDNFNTEDPGLTPAQETTPQTKNVGSEPRTQVYPVKGHGQVPPECCKPWKYADRGDFEFDHVDQLAESFGKEGQLQPAIVRPAKDPADPLIKYEIIAGRARWLSAKKAGTRLDVFVRPLMTDEEAFRIMVQENESRKDLSDYSKGKRFRRALDDKLYPSQAALAGAFKMSTTTLTRLLTAAALDEGILKAFSSPAAISGKLAVALQSAADAGLLECIVRDAKRIESGEIGLAQIPAVWTSGGTPPPKPKVVRAVEEGDEHAKTTSETQKYLATDGRPLFVVKTHGDRYPTVRFKVALDERFFTELKDFVEKRTKKRKR